MFLKQRPGRLFAATLVAFLTLTGCQANPRPAPLPSPEPAPSASPTPTAAAAPTLPPEARGTSMASAKAFVRHYVSLVNHAVTSGSLDELKNAAAPGCDSCDAVIDRVEHVYEAGGYIRSDGWRVRTINIVPGHSPKKPALDVGLRLSPQVVVEKKGGAKRSFDGGRLPATFYLAQSAGTWVVQEWERSA
jgi:hypothetical protein